MSEQLSGYAQLNSGNDEAVLLANAGNGKAAIQLDNSSSDLHGKIVTKITARVCDYSGGAGGGQSSGNVWMEIVRGDTGAVMKTSNIVNANTFQNQPNFTSQTFTFTGNTHVMDGARLDRMDLIYKWGSSDGTAIGFAIQTPSVEPNVHAARYDGSTWIHNSSLYDVNADIYVSTAPPADTNKQVGLAWTTPSAVSSSNEFDGLTSAPTVLTERTSNDLSLQVYVNASVSGTPNHLYTPLQNAGNKFAAIFISSTSAGLYNQKISKVTARINKVSTPTGTLFCRIKKQSDGSIITFGKDGVANAGLDVSTLTTGAAPATLYTFENDDNGQPDTGYALQSGDRIIFELSGGTSSGSAYVQIARTHTSSRIANVHMQVSADGTTWTTPNSGNDDIIGQVIVGGVTTPTITPYHTLGWQNDRISQKVTSNNDQPFNIYNKKITQVEVWLKRVGSPQGTINAVIRNSAGASISPINTINAIDVDNVDFTQYSFPNLNQSHTMGLNERISIEYSGGDVNNHILVNTNLTDSYPYGVLEKYSGGTFIEQAGHDIAGSMSSGGGSTDPLARPRVGERVGTTNSLIKLKTISRIKVRLKRTVSPPGNVLFRIRNAADTVAAELGSISAASIDPNTFTEYTITSSPISLYALQVGDTVSVEYNDGDEVNFVEVMHTKTSDGFDGPTNTYMVKHDDVNWVSNNAVDLVGEFWEGGETFTPSQEDVILPPAVYTKDLTILAGSAPWTYIDHATSTFTHAPSQLNVNAVMPDFRFYRKVLTTTELLNIFANRSDRGAITFGQVTKIGFFSTTET